MTNSEKYYSEGGKSYTSDECCMSGPENNKKRHLCDLLKNHEAQFGPLGLIGPEYMEFLKKHTHTCKISHFNATLISFARIVKYTYPA